MKKLYLTIFFVFSMIGVFSQAIDSAFMKTAYIFYIRPDTTNFKIVQDDLLILEIGKKTSKCYSYYRFLRDSLLSGQFSEQQRIGAAKLSINLNGFSKNGISAILFRSGVNQIITATDQLVLNSYLVIDSVLDMKWSLGSDTMSILGYSCLKANTKFRGRNYIAWYTPEIPVSYGPLKFGGLPGLILNIKEEKGVFEFQCQSIELLKEKVPIIFDKKNYLKVTRMDFRKLLLRMIENPEAFAASTGLEFHTKSCEGCPPQNQKKIVPNFMELE